MWLKKIKKFSLWEFPGSPVVRTWCVQSLVRELRSHKLSSIHELSFYFLDLVIYNVKVLILTKFNLSFFHLLTSFWYPVEEIIA